ncbi:fasciclin domain-containing protein [Deminuibacter soli]|uniref:Fasciclin domain-containing protein n=1 Tax=Deminuibacter soli TaxID=2291815 RepID=A0A3E1NJM9_9BACT|nr:fasciclin domain-containing protein [Deminuibacter soli]RFM28143.1 fasciclin domain-containing protein [Deminuibacter soli]
MKKIIAFLLAVAVVSAVLYGCKNKSAEPPGLSIGQVLANDSSLSIMKKAVDKAGLDTLLRSAATFTFFAPNNEAMIAAGITAASLDNLSADSVKSLVSGHLVATALLQSHIPDTLTIYAVNGDNMHITNNPNGFFVNASPIKQSVLASNGLLEVISIVIKQPSQTIGQYLKADTSFSYLLRVYDTVQVTHLLDSSSGSITLFAPDNNAFRVAGLDIDTFHAFYDSLFGGAHMFTKMVLTSDFIDKKIFPVNNTLLRIAPDTLYSFVTSPDYFMRRYRSDDQPSSLIVKPNILCTNGVIHTLQRAMR